jgi:translation initiation factor 6 (eIF-6)
MGTAYRPPIFERDRPAEKAARVDTSGMEALYESVDVSVVETSVVNPQIIGTARSTTDLNDLSALVREQATKMLEQAEKLESASYRIGYLESQLQSREEQIKLLTVSKKSWWRWFVGA